MRFPSVWRNVNENRGTVEKSRKNETGDKCLPFCLFQIADILLHWDLRKRLT